MSDLDHYDRELMREKQYQAEITADATSYIWVDNTARDVLLSMLPTYPQYEKISKAQQQQAAKELAAFAKLVANALQDELNSYATDTEDD